MSKYGTSIPQYYDVSSDVLNMTPFSMQRRRKRSDSLARWTTKAVLLSPLVILTVWSLVVTVAGTKRVVSSSQQRLSRRRQAVRVPVRPRGVASAYATNEVMMMTGQQQPVQIVQPSSLQSTSVKSNVVVRPRPQPREVHQYDGKIIPVYAPLGESMEAAPMQQQMMTSSQQSANNMMTAQQSANNMMNTQSANIMMAIAQDVAPLQNAVPENVIAMMKTQEEVNPLANTQQTGGAMRATAQDEVLPILPPELLVSTKERIPVVDPLGSSSNLIKLEPPQKGVTTKILYYDPSTAFINGQLYVPQVAYDENGNQVDLQSLSSSTEIYLEPPPLQEMTPPPQELRRQDLERLASPPAQDQYIIVATVAVMALLVGALSARRLRSRSFLNSCIENEALEEEVAYNVATNGDYSTFAWKGDLEKFDV